MRIAVTGCNGGIGRRVVIHCLYEGHSVIGIDCTDPVLDDVDVRRATEHEAFSFIKADLREYDEAFRALRGCDGIAHLAAIRRPEDYLWRTHNTFVFRIPMNFLSLSKL